MFIELVLHQLQEGRNAFGNDPTLRLAPAGELRTQRRHHTATAWFLEMGDRQVALEREFYPGVTAKFLVQEPVALGLVKHLMQGATDQRVLILEMRVEAAAC